MSLQLLLGQSTATGPRERNEDFAGMVTPAGMQLQTKGALIALADGVSGNAGGREAAEMTVRSILSDYYATPDTWEVHSALDKVIIAANRWLLAQAAQHKDFAGMASTLSLIVFRGQRFYSAHVGDTRIYRLRHGELQQLTTDHVWERPDMRHVLKRAIGLDQHLSVDYADGALQVGDVYALMSDGVWDVLDQATLHHVMGLYDNPQLICDELTRLAIAQGGHDNATVLAAHVVQLGEETLTDLLAEHRHLRVPPKMKAGDVIDQFEVLSVLHESRASLIYKVRHRITTQLWVLKTLQPLLAEDRDSCQALLNEEWLAKRVVSQYLPQVLPLTAEQRSQLYYVMSWHEGATLQHRLDNGHHFTTAGITSIGIALLRGLGALHRLQILHRDIKPANLHMAMDQRLRILDLGVALSPVTGHIASMDNPGTPSFMAPELFDGAGASVSSDLYAAGVTLYYLLTRKYPYGEIEPFQHPRFGEPVPPTRYRPEIPRWLENILLKAVARLPEHRFETAEEMLLALEIGETRPILPPPRTPLIARARLVKWQWIALVSLMVNFMLLYLLIVS
ncbi:bifunctional protein-serine/threonine kinase/phosphatase [Methylovorus mays]|uniref:bifunctional protein-serine/threonine kinase/phosphatase n=1 Tax=Methylovorus mays TaxID=184077 RepID=UPI001E40D800|nr:bifunctional protein-serine/threonine kinase/phosphatase [Methylovorus mays]MCB5205747.1 bifunctional protein-serine/threonine kinase/phosphatase [Methylovorus mays]